MIAPQLINMLAGITGHKRSDIDSRAIYLRQVDLLAKGGRGPNAPEMTASDAVNLLLAIAVNGPARSVTRAVQKYRSLADAQGRTLGDFLETQVSKKVTVKSVRICRTKAVTEARVLFKNGNVSFFSDEPSIQEERSPMVREDYTVLGGVLWTIGQAL